MFGFSNVDGMDFSDPIVARSQARVGGWLRGKWRLDRLVGVGGMAAVYEATHRNGSRGAIKVLHRELSLDGEIHQRFLREGYVANAVDHPSVVRVLDDDVAEDGSVFLVMELLEGESLETRWLRKGRRLPPEEVLCALDPILSVLAAAHAKNIVHRDIKPENIFILADGTLKLLDFGIARLREGVGKLTQTGTTMGTPAFMAPEQAMGQTSAIGPRSDLWAVGATLFTLLSGRHVHPGETPNAQLIATATRPAPSLATVLPSAPASLVRLVDTALRFEATDRWPDALSMQAALRETYHALAGSPVQTAPRLHVPGNERSGHPQLATNPSEEETDEDEMVTRVSTPQAALAFLNRPGEMHPPDVPRVSHPVLSQGVARTVPMTPSIDAFSEPSGSYSTPGIAPLSGGAGGTLLVEPPPSRRMVILTGSLVVLALLVGVLLVATLLQRNQTTSSPPAGGASAVSS
jgi:serine/threonine-protein kinase